MNQISVRDFSDPDLLFQIGVAPRRIDILTSISGLSYQEAEVEAVCVDIDGCSIKVLSIEHLIKNKQATGRTKDLADVEPLTAAGPGNPARS